MDLIDFVYLHPKEHVENNLNTNESLSNYYYLYNSNDLSLSNVPKTFNEYVYLNNLSNNLLLNISSLNKDIFDSMVLSGYSSNEVRATYVSIYHSDIYYLQNNMFSSPYLSTSNLSINDNIYLLENDSINMYAYITNIINDSTFELSVNNYNQNNYYKLLGLGIYDPLRTAIISYLTNSNISTRYEYDDEFNPDLYRILYPDTKLSSKENAYINYLNNYPTRIGNVYELNNRLDLSKNATILFNGVKIDGISTNFNSTSANLPLDYEYFITERACKTYVDNTIYNYDDINGVSGSNYIQGLNSELFTNGSSLHNLNIIGNNIISDVYSENIYSENLDCIKIKLDITFNLTIIDEYNIVILLTSNYKCIYDVLRINDEIILFNNKYKVINKSNLDIHLTLIKSTTLLPNLPNPLSSTIYILSKTFEKLYSTIVDNDSYISTLYKLNEYILVDGEYLFKNTTSNHYIDVTSEYDFIVNKLSLYQDTSTLYVDFEIFDKEWIDLKVVTLVTSLQFENIYKFKYVIIANTKYVILNVKRNYNDPKTLLTISRFDGNNIGFDTGLGEYVVVSNINLSNDVSGYFYIEKDVNEDVLKLGTMYISSDDFYLNCDNNLLISSNNIIIRGEVLACDNNFKLKSIPDGILLDCENIFLCSSNFYIDKFGNLNTTGQISSPYFTSEMLSSQSNIITNLMSRIEALEAIVDKYNLFL